MTYAYILDPRGNQIWRYPRADGGFGEKTAWLKSGADINDAKCMAVNDNVFIANENNITKYFKGQKQDFAMEPTDTPVVIEDIFTKPGYDNLYVLDKTNGRIVKLDANGMIIAQYADSEIKNATGFTVDEGSNKIYFGTDSGVKIFEMN